MKKILIFFLPLVFSIIVFVIFIFFISKNTEKGALQITSTPKSKVFLNGKSVGETPFCKCESQDMIAVGDYNLRLVSQEGNYLPFEQKIKISKSVLTVVDRNFGDAASSEGSIISLDKLNDSKSVELLTTSFPEGASVFLDNSPSGTTPLLLKDITASDHELKITKKGYKDKIIRIHTVSGYKLLTTVFLGIAEAVISLTPTPTASPSASVSKIVILQTPTGFLRVREENSLNSPEIIRVYPGEEYELKDEKEGWFQIKLRDGKTGWISSQYANKK